MIDIEKVKINNSASWDEIHHLLEVIEGIYNKTWFDTQLFLESNCTIDYLILFASKETVVDSINEFWDWFHEQGYDKIC